MLVICFTILLGTVVKSNPVEDISEDAVEIVADEIAQGPEEIEGEAFQIDEDSDEDSEELTEEEKERIFGIDIPMCMSHTDYRMDLHFRYSV